MNEAVEAWDEHYELEPETGRLMAELVARERPYQAAIKSLWEVVGQARRQLHGCLEKDQRWEPAWFRAVLVGEFVLSHLGPGGAVALAFFCSRLNEEIPLGDGLTLDRGLVAHAALRSMGKEAWGAVEALQQLEDTEEAGHTLAAIVADDTGLQRQLWAFLEHRNFARADLILAVVEHLQPEPSWLVEAIHGVDDEGVRNQLVAQLQRAFPHHPALPALLARYRGALSYLKAPIQPFERGGRSLEEWLDLYLKKPTEEAAWHLSSMVLGMVEQEQETYLEVEGEGEAEFTSRLQALLEKRPLLGDIYQRLSRVEEPSRNTSSACLVVDLALARSVGTKARELEEEFRRFLGSQAGNGLSRSYVFEMIGGSGCGSLLGALVDYMEQAGRDYDSAYVGALEAAGRLLDQSPDHQMALVKRAVERRDATALMALAQASRLSSEVRDRVFQLRDQDWTDINTFGNNCYGARPGRHRQL